MRQSLLQKRSPPPPSSFVIRDGFVMFVSILILVLVSVAFYVAIKQYLDDRSITINSVIDCAVDNTQRAFGIQSAIEQDKALLDSQTQECERVRESIESNEFDPQFIPVYRQINATIHAANQTCVNEVQRLSTILMQLINGINATADIVGTGMCQFTTTVQTNQTLPIQTVSYEYKRLLLNDLEFYYYVFGANSGPPLLVNEDGARIENCSPIIFNSRQQESKTILYNATGVKELVIGQNRLELRTDAMETLSIQAGFQVFVNFF